MTQGASWKLVFLGEFTEAAKGIFELSEVDALSSLLLSNPYCGKAISHKTAHARRLRFPEAGLSLKGYRPVCHFIVDEEYAEIILVEVYDQPRWIEKMRDPQARRELGQWLRAIMNLLARIGAGDG
jgi:hypothetical protein